MNGNYCQCGHEDAEHTERWGVCHAVIQGWRRCWCPKYEEENNDE